MSAERAVAEARAAGFAAELLGGTVPFIPASELTTMERTREALRWIGRCEHVGGGRMLAEGIVLEPPRFVKPEPQWPFTEPEIVERYGLVEPDDGVRVEGLVELRAKAT